MPLHFIDDPLDPRLDRFRDLRDRDQSRGQGRLGHFIAEQWFVVERVLAVPGLCEALLVAPRFLQRLTAETIADIATYVLADEHFERVVGFDYHRGILAIGRRDARLEPTLEDLAGPVGDRRTLLVCERITHIDNMGALFRVAAAFGVDGVILCPESCDPLYRRSLRVGIGYALHIPWRRSADLATDLNRLAGFGFTRLASALSEDSQDYAAVAAPARAALLVGHEGLGLDAKTLSCTDLRVQIPMAPGVDSLNVAVAAAVLLARFRSDR